MTSFQKDSEENRQRGTSRLRRMVLNFLQISNKGTPSRSFDVFSLKRKHKRRRIKLNKTNVSLPPPLLLFNGNWWNLTLKVLLLKLSPQSLFGLEDQKDRSLRRVWEQITYILSHLERDRTPIFFRKKKERVWDLVWSKQKEVLLQYNNSTIRINDFDQIKVEKTKSTGYYQDVIISFLIPR